MPSLRLPTRPNALLKVLGPFRNLKLKTSNQSHELSIQTQTTHLNTQDDQNGNITLHCTTQQNIDIHLPAAYFVHVHAQQHADVHFEGWLEGGLDINVPMGDIHVGTVRGENTKLTTGKGRVSAKFIEGNLTLQNANGDAELGKVMGELTNIDAPRGSVRCDALYSKVLRATAGCGMYAKVLGSDSSFIATNGDVSLNMLQGTVDLVHGSGSLSLQATDRLRELRIVAESSMPSGESSMPAVSLSLPEKLRCLADFNVAEVSIDERLKEAGGEGFLGPDSADAQCKLEINMPGSSLRVEQRSWLDQMLAAKR